MRAGREAFETSSDAQKAKKKRQKVCPSIFRIIYLTKDKVRTYRYALPKERRAMTVAIGLSCFDGSVLCTDSQISVSGGLKYPAKKIHTLSYGDWSVGLAYAGSPLLMELVVEELYPRLLDARRNALCERWGDMVRSALQEVLRETCKKHKRHHVEILCAASAEDGGEALWRARDALVTDVVQGVECLGVGDSSILRFLADVFVRPYMSIIEGIALACYMVSKAIVYIDGCDGPLQTVVLDDCGHYYELDMNKWGKAATLESTEQAIGDLFYDLAEHGDSKLLVAKSFTKFREHLSGCGWPDLVDFDPEKFRADRRNDPI